jgi:hypothetical protein
MLLRFTFAHSQDALSEIKRKAEVVIDQVSVDKHVNDDDIRAKLNELHYGFACSSEAEARFLVLYDPTSTLLFLQL